MFHIQTPPDFNFYNTARSHGWSSLAPFSFDLQNVRLKRRFGNISTEIFERGGELFCQTSTQISDARQKNEIERVWRHVLRLDEDYGEFYALVAETPDFKWIAEKGAGRLLRSPTVFEDLIKTVCTTNCSWTLTLKMTANIVREIGKGSFPSAEEMAQLDAEFYQTKIRAGYRAQFLHDIAFSVAARTLPVETWLDKEIPTAELKKLIKNVRGCGEYAADNLLKLLGHYDVLALDSMLRSRFYQKRNGGAKCTDAEIAAFYARFGKWRGLVIWCDLTRADLQQNPT